MSAFSASDAALEGFQVLRRHWRVIVGWAGFNLLAMICMVVVTVIVAVVTAALVGSNVSALSSTLGVVAGGVGAVLVWTVMMAGLYRLMLRPEEPAFLHLRLGPDELRLLALALILVLALATLASVVGLVTSLVRPIAPVLPVVVDILALVAGVWLVLRLALSGPATFAERRLALDSSWRLTGGHAPPLLGMLVLVGCIAALIIVVGWMTLFLVLGLTTGFTGVVDMIAGRDQASPMIYILQIAAQLIFAPVIWVITGAPAVAAYQALAKDA